MTCAVISINIDCWKRGQKKLTSAQDGCVLKISNGDEIRWENDRVFKLFINTKLKAQSDEDLTHKIIDIYKWYLLENGYKIVNCDSTFDQKEND